MEVVNSQQMVITPPGHHPHRHDGLRQLGSGSSKQIPVSYLALFIEHWEPGALGKG